MKDVVDDVRAWTARGDRVAIATVVGVRRSAPRPPGAQSLAAAPEASASRIFLASTSGLNGFWRK